MSITPQKVDRASYETVADFIDAANTVLVNASNADIVAVFREDKGQQFGASFFGAGCRNGLAVQTLVNDGWQEGRTRVDGFLSKLETIELAPRDMRRRLTLADMGDHLNIGDVYAGRFATAWTRATRQTGFGPQRGDLVANMITAGSQSPDVLFWRGAAAVALCDKLEAAGYMVRLIVGFGGKGMGADKVSCRITVKNHDMPLDLSTASSVMLPGFFRAIGHQWIAAHAPRRSDCVGISVKNCDTEAGEIFLSHEVSNEAGARARVEQVIHQLDAATTAAA